MFTLSPTISKKGPGDTGPFSSSCGQLQNLPRGAGRKYQPVFRYELAKLISLLCNVTDNLVTTAVQCFGFRLNAVFALPMLVSAAGN
jgi:hypothetical protein